MTEKLDMANALDDSERLSSIGDHEAAIKIIFDTYFELAWKDASRLPKKPNRKSRGWRKFRNL